MGKYLTDSEYQKRLTSVSKNIIPLEPYSGINTKIKHKCLRHNIEWDAFPTNTLRGHGCPECGRELSAKGRKKNISIYLEELSVKNIPVLPIEDYKGATVKIRHRCTICNNIWMASPHNILRGKEKCEMCKNKKRKQDFCLSIAEYNPDIEVIGDYVSTTSKIKVKCKKCSTEWELFGTELYKHRECPCCGNPEGRMLEETYVSLLEKNNPDVILIANFEGISHRAKFECVHCGYQWNTNAGNVLRHNTGCPICNNGKSKGEKIITRFLNEYAILYEVHKTFPLLNGIGGNPLSYDFYLPLQNMLIEFQGIQHTKPISWFGGGKQFETQQEHDRRKREYAKAHNITLLEIWYYDIDNIEQILKENLNLETLETAGCA